MAIDPAPISYFTLDELEPFLPGKNLQDLPKMYGKGDLVNKKGQLYTYRFTLFSKRFNLPLYIQVHQQIILDLFLSFPSFFMHRTLHQLLIKKWGKQGQYTLKENSAYYLWEVEKRWRVRYSAACTFSCYPLFLAVETVEAPKEAGNYQPFSRTIYSSQFP